MPELPEAVYDILRFWQNETHYLSYRHSPLHRHQHKRKRKTPWGLKLLGASLIAVCVTIGLLHPQLEAVSHFLSTHQPWLLGIGIGIGLFCLFK